MRHIAKMLCAGLVLASFCASAAFADERVKGKAPTKAPEAVASVPDLGARQVKRQAPLVLPVKPASPTKTRSAEQLKKSFTLVGRSKDGKEVKKELSDEAIRSLLGEKADQRGAVDIQDDPVVGPATRMIVGKDNRVRVAKTTEFPYSAAGLLYYEDPSDPDYWYTCTGVMVAPRTMITNANCLFNYDFTDANGGKGWLENFEFFPGYNGDGAAPLGSYIYETAYVFEGWIDEYDGTWDSISSYAIGAIVFAEDVSEYSGHLGYWGFADDTPKMNGTLVDYPDDKDLTMWRSSCTIQANYTATMFTHVCDSNGYGEPLFVYDKAEDSRYVVGITIATQDNKSNVALRLNGAIFDWIDVLEKQ